MEIVILLVVLAVLVVGGITFVGLRARRGTDLEPPPSARLDPTAPGGVLTEERPTTADEGDRAGGTVVAPPPEPAVVEPPVKPSFRDRLAKARGTFSGYLGSIRSRKVDAETWDELEEALIRADVGVAVTQQILDELRTTAKAESITDPEHIRAMAHPLRLELLDLLHEVGEATATELRAEVELLQGSTVYAPHKPYGGSVPVGPRVLTHLSAAGEVVRASNRSTWTNSRPAWARTATWLGEQPVEPPEREARAELVRRWLRAFGPATAADLKWWLGSTVTAVSTALADIGAVEVDLHGEPGIALADDLEVVEAPEPYAALLPGLDPTTMGWQRRDWYLGPHREALFDTSGNGGMTAWWDGRIVGGWNQEPDGTVVLQLLEDVGADAQAALAGRAAQLTSWLDGVVVTPRFPSPLWRSTRAKS